MIILPGGIPGTPNLLAYKPLTDKILEFKENGKLLSAVCAAPTVYGQLGILKTIKLPAIRARKLILIVPNISPNLLLLTDSSRQAVAWVPALNLQELLSHA